MATSFIAFGQDHTDGSALEAVQKNLTALHNELTSQGKELVLAIEHSQEDVRMETPDIAELHNEGLALAYFDDKRLKGEKPSYEDFMAKFGPQLRRDSKSVKTLTVDDLMDLPERFRQRKLPDRQKFMMETFYKRMETSSKEEISQGKGQSRLIEAQILQYAKDHNVRVVGLDPLSNSEKSKRLSGGKTTDLGRGISFTQSTGKVDGTALEDMEYERVQGMSQNVCNVMSDLAKKNGGCVVAINMGPAHLASLELAMREEMTKRPELDKSPIRMCVMNKGTPEQSRLEGDRMMTLGPDEMISSVERAQHKLQTAQQNLAEAQNVVQELEGLIQRFDDLSEQELVDLTKNPGDLMNHLNKGIQDSDLELELETVEEMLQQAKLELSQGGHTTLKAAMSGQMEVFREGLQTAQQKVVSQGVEVQTAQQELQKRQGQDDFAKRVKQRLGSKPEGVFVSAPSNTPGGYGSTVRKTMQESNGLKRVESVGEVLGKKFSKQERHLQEVNQGIGESDLAKGLVKKVTSRSLK